MRALACLLCALGAAATAQDLLIRNATVYPVSGPRIDNASVLVLGGKISEIGAKVTLPKNAKGFKIVDGKGLSVYPGMIDSATQIGISEIGSVRETNDSGEVGDFNPQLRALVAVNPESEHIPVVRANGITSAIVVPANIGGGGGGGFGAAAGGFIGGQVSLIHLNGWTWEEMEINRGAGMHLRFPVVSAGAFNPETFSVSRGNYTVARQNKDNQVRQIKNFFEQARRYKTAKDAGSPDWKSDTHLEAMIPVLEGKMPLMVLASREREIREAIEWADQERVKIILANVRKPGKALDLIVKKSIPVIVSPTLAAPQDEDDPYDEPYTNPATLAKAGVQIAFGSFGNEFSRNLPYQAAMAVNFGLPYEEGLKAITLNPARIWGVADKYGSIEPGKMADLILTDGDLLEARTQVKMMFIHGVAVDLESKHTRLYKKYLARP